MSSTFEFFATCPKGIESLLTEELRALGATNVRETRAGAAFTDTLAIAYRVCLWSRFANRVLLPLAHFPAPSPEALYQGVQTVSWENHIAPTGTIAVDCVTTQSIITHSHYGALKVKDAIVDQLRAATGVRPSVDTDQPDLRINVYIHRDEASISIDLSGDSLHRRGYRIEGVAAPLKENLAAAILARAGWVEIARAGGALIDPMCGSGTLLIEGALMAADIAPGLARPYFGFLKWRRHDATLWSDLLNEAYARRDAGLQHLPPIFGYDSDKVAIRSAKTNIAQANLAKYILVETRPLTACASDPDAPPGLIVANPPYGERLGDLPELPALYVDLGEALKRGFSGWRAAVFTGNPELGKYIGIRAKRMHTLYNGALECKLLRFDIDTTWFMRSPPVPGQIKLSAGAEMFANRLRKDLKHFGRWAKRQGVHCYRLYDADMHEYNVAVDVYEGDLRYVNVQEYHAPDSVDPRAAERRLNEALAVIPTVLEIPKEQMFFRVRRRQKGHTQYEKLATTGAFHEVREGPCRFLVNFTDYLDTGLFIDHRLTRAMLGEMAKGKTFLNLFGYTGTATLHAVLGGATATTTVDMSYTYLDWAQRHLALNGQEKTQNELIQANVLKWLKENASRHYGLIFLDPPTFSRSKRMEETFDIQRDHVELIKDTTALLEPDGILVFSTNNQRFRLDHASLEHLDIKDITHKTIPKDFERNPKIHQCFKITHAR